MGERYMVSRIADILGLAEGTLQEYIRAGMENGLSLSYEWDDRIGDFGEEILLEELVEMLPLYYKTKLKFLLKYFAEEE